MNNASSLDLRSLPGILPVIIDLVPHSPDTFLLSWLWLETVESLSKVAMMWLLAAEDAGHLVIYQLWNPRPTINMTALIAAHCRLCPHAPRSSMPEASVCDQIYLPLPHTEQGIHHAMY